MTNNYVPYHMHTMYSLLDSSTSYKAYVDRAAELGMKAICFSEHGNVFGWFEKMEYCKQKGIKFLYGIECYLTESSDAENKVRDNYHTVLIAKNHDGFVELNRLISKSWEPEQFYYKPRITFEQFLGISDNIIKISACLASPLWSFRRRLDEADAAGEDTAMRREVYLQIASHYDYLEIQYHGGDQIEYNKLLYEMSKELGIPLIAGTDTHNIDQYSAECRIMLKYGKTEGDWGDSENNFDLTFKTYDELVEAFRAHGALPESVFMDAINNTNVMADSVDELIIDTSIRYPILYEGQDEEQIMQDRVMKMYHDKVSRGVIDGNDHRYLDNIATEMAVFKKINMLGFMLFMSELMTWARSENIFTSPCRGSVGGSTVAYITDIIDLDPVKRHTVFSRFANEYREEIGDIDTDWYEDDRPRVYQHIFDRFGMRKCAYILAVGTLADAAVIDTVGKALRVIAQQRGEESPFTLDKIAEIKKDWQVDREATRTKYPELFRYYDGLAGCIVSQSMHPAGIVVAPIDLVDNFSVFQKDGVQIVPLCMDEIHDCGLVKYDILGLKNVGIISKTCSYVGCELPHENTINWDDQDVFDDMVKNPVGVFQFESEYAFRTLREYHDNIKKKGMKFSIDDMTLCNACIRPSGASYRDDLISLKSHKNPSTLIDDLLSNTHGFLVYQEQVIAFLQEICGLSGGEADNVRRAIGRKQAERLDAALPSILDGYCKKSDKPREVAEAEAKEFIKVIEDASSYMFGFNHATGYSMVGYLCAYYRYYYPIEFCTAFLNCSKSDEDITNGTELAKSKGFKIMPPRFRYSKAGFFYDKGRGEIYKSIDSIKYMSSAVADELYALRDNQYESFVDLLYDLREKTSIDARQLEILTRLNFFEEFGDMNKLVYTAYMFDKLAGRKSIQRNQLEELRLTEDIICRYADKNTPSRVDEIDVERWLRDHGEYNDEVVEKLTNPKSGLSTRRAIKMFDISEEDQVEYATKIVSGGFSELHNRDLLVYLEEYCDVPKASVKDQINYQQEYLGYIDYADSNMDPRCVVITQLDTKYSPRFMAYCLKNGKTCEMKIHAKHDRRNKSIVTAWSDLPLVNGDIIYMKKCEKLPRQKKVGDKWEKVPGEWVWWVNDYSLYLTN